MAKGRTKAKKRAPATVDSVLDECRAAMRKGLGKKRLSKEASDYWEKNHRDVIQKLFDDHKADWDKDKLRVVPTAKKLGKVAAALATGNIVLLWAAEAAHEAVKDDPGCPTLGAGGYCDF